MKIINRFIDWRKNIQLVDYFGISVIFDTKETTFEEIRQQLFSAFELIPDVALKKQLILGDITYRMDEYGSIYECQQDYPMHCRPATPYSFSLSYREMPKLKLNRIVCEYRLDSINHDILVFLSRLKGLSIMILFNPAFKYWENNQHPDSYKYKGGVKTYYCEMHQMEKVDIADRSGKIANLGNVIFHGGAEFWFGPSFYKYVPKERILEFEHADLVEELPNNIIHIKLMDIKDYWTGEGQGRLSDLRYQLNIDSLEKAYQASLAR